MLEVTNLEACYGAVQVIKGISLKVPEHKIVSIVGSNGSGKSTLLRTICGIIKAARGRIGFLGKEIQNRPPENIVRLGISMVPEGRELFSDMTVLENLELGGYLHGKVELAELKEKVFSLFPVLRDRARQTAGMLSGGQQQMLAIGMALMAKPKLLLLDEPSLGLAPLVRAEIFNEIVHLNKQEGMNILLVEQNVNMALSISEYGYVLEMGKVSIEGGPDYLLDCDIVKKSYLGQ